MFCLALAESVQLVPDGTLFLHIAIILTMIFVLNRTLFRPINRILEERERRTHGRSGEAREILQRVEESLSKYERTMMQARIESYRLLEQKRAEAVAERQSRIDLVKEEIGNKIEQQREEVRGQAREARTTLESEARRVAVSVSTHILGRPSS
ncbi:MAG: ATP synthase F0 subunit B [Pyrinomonadaceae bacterium]